MPSKQDSRRIAKVYSDENSSCFACKDPLWGTPSRLENLSFLLDTKWTVWQHQHSMTLSPSPISISSHAWPQLILKPTTFPNPYLVWPYCCLYLMSGHHTATNIAQASRRFSGSLSRPSWTRKVEASSVSLSRKEEGIASPSYSSKEVKPQQNFLHAFSRGEPFQNLAPVLSSIPDRLCCLELTSKSFLNVLVVFLSISCLPI